jgi:hypothetical protein
MATGQGNITFNFGAAPGTNVVTTNVTGLTTISAGSKVELYLMGTDSTAEHNAVEHQMLPLGGISIQPISVTAGTGFQGQIMTPLRITGNITARYVWAD